MLKNVYATIMSAVKTLKKLKNIESPKIVSKRLYGHYLRSYEQIKNFQIKKNKSDFPRGKRLEYFLMEKPSAPLRNLVFFSKKMIKKQ